MNSAASPNQAGPEAPLPDPADRHVPDGPIQKRARRGQLPKSARGPNLADLTLPFWILAAVFVMALAPLLAKVPTTESSGPAWAFLLLLPAGIATVFTARRWRFLERHGLLLLLAGLSFLAGTYGDDLDRFEARRTALVLATSLLAYLAGYALSVPGRKRVLQTLAWLPWALLSVVVYRALDSSTSWSQALSDTAGNRSDLAEFVWPGMVCACSYFLSAQNKAKAMAAGVGALAVAAWYGTSPVYAGVFALLATCGLVCVLGWRHAAAARLGRALLLGAAICAVAIGARHVGSSHGSQADGPGPSALQADREQGLAVRVELWKSTLAALPHHVSGFGPGQFQREYPPYRSPVERLRSSHGDAFQNSIEVEHAHNDLLNALAEWGWFFGGLLVLLYLGIGLAAGRALLRGDTARMTPAAIWLGTLAWGWWNAPLTAPVFSHVLPWTCAGMLLRPAELKGLRTAMSFKVYRFATGRKLGPGLILALAALLVPHALGIIRHGAALSHASLDGNDRKAERAIRSALAIQPDSAFALDLWAHYGSGLKESQLKAFETLTEIRPYQRGSWNDWGTRLARLGRFEEAAEKFALALEVDPDFDLALRNHVAALEDLGDRERLQAALRDAVDRGAMARTRLLPRAQFLLTQGLPELAAVYAQAHNPELDFTNPDLCYAQSQAAQAAGEESAERAYRVGAQQGFARDHAERGDWESALRNYRLALRAARAANDRGLVPLALRLEMAAALQRSQRPEAAREELLGLSWSSVSARLRNHAPKWAVEALPSIMAP